MQQEDIIIVFSFYYMDALGLSSGEQTDVIQKADTHAAMIKCLNIWKRKTLSQMTFMALLDILVKLKKGTIAVQVCQYIYMKVHECLCVLP